MWRNVLRSGGTLDEEGWAKGRSGTDEEKRMGCYDMWRLGRVGRFRNVAEKEVLQIRGGQGCFVDGKRSVYNRRSDKQSDNSNADMEEDQRGRLGSK